MGRRKVYRTEEDKRQRNAAAQRRHYQKVKLARAQELELAQERTNAPGATKQNLINITLIYENGRMSIVPVADTLHEIAPDHPNCPGPFMFVSVGRITSDNYLEEC